MNRNPFMRALAALLIVAVVARIVLAQITASVIGWITGKNSSGKPSFVTNLSANLQGVGDAVAISFISRTATAFNSPFGSAISLSLQLKYNQQTSLAGFFAANKSTLVTPTRSLASVNSFLNGNWSQGGIPAWFALTTQSNNNPYTLYQAAQSQLGSSVGQAQTNRRQDLIQSQGFLSFCSTTATADETQSAAAAAYQQCQDTNGVNADCLSAYTGAGGSTSLSNGVKPGDSCTNGNGTPGTIQTPGSILHDYTQKAVVNTGMEELISAQDLDQALGAIAMALVSQVISGSGLLGASTPSSSSRPAITAQLQTYSGDTSSSSGSAISISQTMLTRLTTYTTAWQTIVNAEQAASSTVIQLGNTCPNQANAVQTALTGELAPVLTQWQSAMSAIKDTRTLALKVQTESTSATTPTAVATLSTDTQLLAIAPPSATDVMLLQQEAQVLGGATANPAGSLTVSGGTKLDQMNLIGTNAAALIPTCGLTPVDSVVLPPAG